MTLVRLDHTQFMQIKANLRISKADFILGPFFVEEFGIDEGETFEFLLIDVGDEGLVARGQPGGLIREFWVEIVERSLGSLLREGSCD